MKKKRLILLIILIGLLTITGCSKEKQTDAQRFKEEYESINNKTINNKKVRNVSINENNPMIYKEAKDIVEMMNNGETFIVYFGFSDCPWCRSMIETLLEVAKDYNIEKIYYVDIKNIRDIKEVDEEGNIVTKKEGDKYYIELLDKLDMVLKDYKVDDISMNEKRIYAPTVIALTDGTPIELTTGLAKEQKDPYQKITKSMKKIMYKNLECLAKCVNEASTICKKNAC